MKVLYISLTSLIIYTVREKHPIKATYDRSQVLIRHAVTGGDAISEKLCRLIFYCCGTGTLVLTACGAVRYDAMR